MLENRNTGCANEQQKRATYKANAIAYIQLGTKVPTYFPLTQDFTSGYALH